MDTLFNVIACLIACIKENDANYFKETSSNIAEKESDEIFLKVKKIVDAFDKKGDADDLIHDIIVSCKKGLINYAFEVAVVLFDAMIDQEDMKNTYDMYNPYGLSDKGIKFESLNDNQDQTGVLLIPKFNRPPNTFYCKDNCTGEEHDKKCKTLWDINYPFNSRLKNVSYVFEEDLNGIKLENAVLDIFHFAEVKEFNIGLAQVSSRKLEELMHINKYKKADSRMYFNIDEYYNEAELTENYKKCCDTASGHDISLMVSVEMHGTEALTGCDKNGFNSNYKQPDEKGPRLFFSPSYWKDGKNCISIYIDSGKMIGSQYKMNSFYLPDDNKPISYMEDLKNDEKKVMVLHVPGVGRISLLICADQLNTECIDLLTRILNVDYIICSSYSLSSKQFIDSVGLAQAYGTRLVWINACSAVKDEFSDIIGAVAVPRPGVVSDDGENGVKMISKKCKGGNCTGCVYKVSIPLISTDERKCNQVTVEQDFNC